MPFSCTDSASFSSDVLTAPFTEVELSATSSVFLLDDSVSFGGSVLFSVLSGTPFLLHDSETSEL